MGDRISLTITGEMDMKAASRVSSAVIGDCTSLMHYSLGSYEITEGTDM